MTFIITGILILIAICVINFCVIMSCMCVASSADIKAEQQNNTKQQGSKLMI